MLMLTSRWEFIIFCQTLHTSWHVSCIPEAYLVHRSEGGEVENLDISIYISTFLTIMHTMHTLHTFLEKVYMMKVRESKRNKKVLWYKKYFHPSSLTPQQPFPRGYAGMQVCMVVKRGEISTFFTPFPDTYSLHILSKNLHPR